MTRHAAGRGFHLIELVVALTIVGIIAAIAVPRMTSASGRANDTAVEVDLAVLRNALQMYQADHNGSFPAALTALTKYTSPAGAMSSNPTSTNTISPYLRAIPPCPTGPSKGAIGWAAVGSNPPGTYSPSPSVGWLYHSASGGVWVNDPDYLDW